MSWTLTKKLEASAGPGEIKRRTHKCWTHELAQKRSRAGRWSSAWELDFFCFSCFPTAELRTLSLWLFCIAAGTAVAWCGGRCTMLDGHCLNILLFWRPSMTALAFRVGACLEVSFFCPLFPTRPPSLIGLLASVDVKQQHSLKLNSRPKSGGSWNGVCGLFEPVVGYEKAWPGYWRNERCVVSRKQYAVNNRYTAADTGIFTRLRYANAFVWLCQRHFPNSLTLF